MRPIRCPETTVNDYHSTLRNTPEDRRSHQYRGESLKPLKHSSLRNARQHSAPSINMQHSIILRISNDTACLGGAAVTVCPFVRTLLKTDTIQTWKDATRATHQGVINTERN
jgi:hypothetical protein